MKERNIRSAAVLMAICLTVGMSVSAAGCGLDGLPSKEEKGKLSTSTENLTQKYSQGGEEDTGVSVTDDFKQAYADFSLELLKESRVQGDSTNTMLSPLSVMAALEMTRNGAVGETREQMDATLYALMQPEEGSRQLMAYLLQLPDEEKAQFHFANSIWLHTGNTDFVPSESFLESSARDYRAEIYGAPFDDSTCRDINNWIRQETDGMIPDMLEEISAEAIMYLINAVAFDAEWQEPYTTNQIHDAEFTLEDGSKRKVSMMYSGESVLLEDEKAVGFLKPYQSGYAFMALLPHENVKLSDYLAQLTGEDFCRLLETSENTLVETGLPKFTSETSLSLNGMLERMGMPLAFDPIQADFSGMGRCEERPIYIDQVLHKTYIEVDELGTRAGAATVVAMETGAAMDPKTVILDRPFLYAIVDTESNLPIFLGVMEEPD